MYKLYVEERKKLHFVTEDDYLSNIQKIMFYNERDIAEQYNTGLVHFIVFRNGLEIINEYRYRGQTL